MDGKDDCEIIQKNLNHISEWSEKWEMSFNFNKCKVMHTPGIVIIYPFWMENLCRGGGGNNLRFTIIRDLKHVNTVKKHITKLTLRMLIFMAKIFERETLDVMPSLHNPVVRLHLEYAVKFWSPNNYYRRR